MATKYVVYNGDTEVGSVVIGSQGTMPAINLFGTRAADAAGLSDTDLVESEMIDWKKAQASAWRLEAA